MRPHRIMNLGALFLIDIASLFVFLVAVVAIPAAIVYRRNRGTLSLGQSYQRAFLYVLRVVGWCLVVVGLTFVPFIVAGLTGHLHGYWPWWSLPFILAYIAVGYGLQRLMTFLVKDEDLKNMFWSKER